MIKKMNVVRIARGAAFLAFVAAAGSAMASDGHILFSGKVLSTTCTIVAGGGATGGKNMTVKLPTVSSSALRARGDVAGRTPFSIQLTGCTGDATKVSTVFEAGSTVDSASGRLNLVSAGPSDSVAGNVQINLLNASQEPIKAGLASSQQNSQVVKMTDRGATLDYFAEYYATAAATAGSANSRIEYSLEYQ